MGMNIIVYPSGSNIITNPPGATWCSTVRAIYTSSPLTHLCAPLLLRAVSVFVFLHFNISTYVYFFFCFLHLSPIYTSLLLRAVIILKTKRKRNTMQPLPKVFLKYLQSELTQTYFPPNWCPLTFESHI